jgi:hypothetical protein
VRQVPWTLTIAWTVLVGVLVPVYWLHYGPANFLWGSDIALLLVLASLWTGRALPNSMMAIGVLPFELAWLADLLSGAQLLGVTAYMFEADRPVILRLLSLFHVALPVAIVFLLQRLGYDRRALPAQVALTWIVLPATYLLTDPVDNINFAFGPGRAPQQALDPRLYLAIVMVALPLAVTWPAHLLLRRLLPPP